MQTLKWQITQLPEPVQFQGLGQMKQTTIPAGVEVLVAKDQVLAIPGVSGGDSTKVETATRNIIVEIASFPGERIARSSYTLNYRSEGSRIWAGDVKQQRVNLALVQMRKILENNEITHTLSQVGHWQKPDYVDDTPAIIVDLFYIAARLDNQGVDHWHPILLNKLQFLGEVKVYPAKSELDVEAEIILQPNVYYSYIQNQDDILTELIRLIGFSNLNRENMVGATQSVPKSDFDRYQSLKEIVALYGFHEVITRPFVTPAMLLNPITQAVRVMNPSNSTEPYLRDNLVLSLLRTLAANLLQGEKSPHIFELNQTNSLQQDQIQISLDLVLVGVSPDPYFWTSLVFYLANKMQLNDQPRITKALNSMGQTTQYTFNSTTFDLIQVSNKTKKSLNLPINKDFWSLSIKLNNWFKIVARYRHYQDLSNFPVIRRSYTIDISPSFTWQDMSKVLESVSIPNCQISWDATGRTIINSQDKLSYAVEFVSYSRTLSGVEIEEWETAVMSCLSK